MIGKITLCLIMVCGVLLMKAQSQDSLIYYNAGNFEIIGKGFSGTEMLYDRLPGYLKDTLRSALWKLSKNSSGIAVRFCSNTTAIGLKWEALFLNDMNHMAATGVRGLDLYSYEKDHWQYMCTAKPGEKKSQVNLISNMQPVEREYLLYLPLYDGVVSVEIGIDQGAAIANPNISQPKKDQPIVFYGTSITQGGCASRPGMAYPSIVERKMNIETINLGFSGNGLMDWEILEAMLTIDASCYVIDCLPNCDIQRVNERGYKFISRLLEKKKGIPVVMVGEAGFTQSYFDLTIKNKVDEKNQVWKSIYDRLKNEGNNNLYFIPGDQLIGDDYEGTVDGRHFTDLGFQRCAEKMTEVINPLIKQNK